MLGGSAWPRLTARGRRGGRRHACAALGRGRTRRRHRSLGSVIGAPVTAVDQHRVGDGAGLAIDRCTLAPFRREMLVAPGEQREQHRAEIAPARGQHIFVARRVLAVAPALQQAGLDQRVEPARQHVRRDAEALLELVEARQPVRERRAGSACSTTRPPARGCGRSGRACRRSSCAALTRHRPVTIIMQVTVA